MLPVAHQNGLWPQISQHPLLTGTLQLWHAAIPLPPAVVMHHHIRMAAPKTVHLLAAILRSSPQSTSVTPDLII